jgi:AcrR family transcriptional regulator
MDVRRPGPANATTATEPSPEPLPEPPWRTPPRGRAAPHVPLSRDAIVEAALRVLDREGMEGLSMRKVGEELGTGAASLYWHVRNKDELLQLVFERVSSEVDLPEPDPSRWQEQLKDLARQMRAVLNRHRDVARISLGRIPGGADIARVTEWLFQLLRGAGIPDQAIAYLGDIASLYVAAYAFEESLGLASPTGEDQPPEQIVEMLKDWTRSLPEDRFPITRSVVDLLFAGDADDRFEFGIDLIVRGLESLASAR